MTTTTANLDKFRQVYADAVIHDMTDEQFRAATKVRDLRWRGKRMPLAEAAAGYATLCDGYNNFQPNMLADLLTEFPDAGIDVTPARESSVAVYLHVPAASLEAVTTFVKANWEADEVGLQEVTALNKETNGDIGLRIWWD